MERRSLLGTYPAPFSNMLATPPSAANYPTRWRPPSWSPQYGYDYRFREFRAGRPVRWQLDQPIIVRLCGPHRPEQAAAVTTVIAELAELTGLNLAVGEPWPRLVCPSAVLQHEIHVGFMADLPPVPLFRPCTGLTGVGGAVFRRGASFYTRGVAIVALGAMRPRSREVVVAILRHQLAHALGLGHAGRRELLMGDPIPLGIADFGAGDRYGLRSLYDATRNHQP
jgi:hypothetical protein